MAKRAAGFVIFRRISEEIQFLLLRASYGELHWSPPKGHVDPGEDDFTTALRETKEEAGYTECDLKIYKDRNLVLNYQVNGKPKIVTYWLAELKDPLKEAVLSEEHTELKWLKRDEAIEIVRYKESQGMIDAFYKMILDLKEN